MTGHATDAAPAAPDHRAASDPAGGATAGPHPEGGDDAATGRGAILRAARRAFVRRPYAEVTMRGIAADAGVSASLIVKHFGSKDQLFAIVADFGAAADELLAAPADELGRHLVLTLVRSRRVHQADPLLRVVFSLGNTDERSLLRSRFREQITERLAELLTGADRELRAELIAGQLIGLGVTLSLHSDGAGARTSPERLADLCAPALQRLITGATD